MTYYPSIEEVLEAHARLIERFGGAFGVRDQKALESALARPQSGYYNDLLEQAAALLESIWQNHPFIDGNKRTAIAVTAAFLRVNNYQLEFGDLEAYGFLMRLERERRFRFKDLLPWLREHVKPALSDH